MNDKMKGDLQQIFVLNNDLQQIDKVSLVCIDFASVMEKDDNIFLGVEFNIYAKDIENKHKTIDLIDKCIIDWMDNCPRYHDGFFVKDKIYGQEMETDEFVCHVVICSAPE